MIKKQRRVRKSSNPDYQSMTGDMIKMGTGALVGTAMIGATAGMVQGLPAGTAKSVAGIVPGLQSVALVGHSLKYVPGMTKKKKRRY